MSHFVVEALVKEQVRVLAWEASRYLLLGVRTDALPELLEELANGHRNLVQINEEPRCPN